jgi:hypothetical protein
MIIDTLSVDAEANDDVFARKSIDGVTVEINGRNHRRLTVFLPTDLAAELLGQLLAIASERVSA